MHLSCTSTQQIADSLPGDSVITVMSLGKPVRDLEANLVASLAAAGHLSAVGSETRIRYAVQVDPAADLSALIRELAQGDNRGSYRPGDASKTTYREEVCGRRVLVQHYQPERWRRAV
jgi:hypothetical protein